MKSNLLITGLALCSLHASLLGDPEETSPKLEWTAQSMAGAQVRVPGSGVTVLAFVRVDQANSKSAVEHIKGSPGLGAAQVIVIVSGEQARSVKAVNGADPAWPVVIDPEFKASGYFKVHVWPTTIVIRQDGQQAAHLAGLSGSFAADLEDYMEFALGKIDAATLKSRLADHTIVGDGNRQKADRRLIIATQLMERGELDQARTQIDEGLTLRPGDPKLSAMLVRLLLLQKQPQEALGVLQKLQPGSMPEWQCNLLRARALIDLERWDEARAAARLATKLNPEPAEALYVRGLIRQHDGKWQEAAEEFRKAYESVAQQRQ